MHDTTKTYRRRADDRNSHLRVTQDGDKQVARLAQLRLRSAQAGTGHDVSGVLVHTAAADTGAAVPGVVLHCSPHHAGFVHELRVCTADASPIARRRHHEK